MITWTRHAGNYQMKLPSDDFPVAIWIGSARDAADNLTYSLSIYAGGKLIKHTPFRDFETAENAAGASRPSGEWLEKLQKDVDGLLFQNSFQGY